MAWLTKSRFLSGLQCHKRLWSELHAPLAEPGAEQMTFVNGRAFDELVQRLQPGTVISRSNGMPAAIADTARRLLEGIPATLHQPAFRIGDLAVIADVLRHEANAFTLVEVKSSTSVKPEHLPDAGYQTLVLRQAGIPVQNVRIAHVDNRFVLRAAGDYHGLVIEEDVTAKVEAALPAFADAAAACLDAMNAPQAPAVAMSTHCSMPYECPFTARCSNERGPLPKYPVTVLPLGGKVVQALLADGIEDLTQVPDARLTSPMHRRVREATVNGQPFFAPAATAALRAYPYPMSHLDFETMGFAVPEVIGSRPYEQLPFQFSVHIEKSPTEIEHREFLALETFGDFGQLANHLLAAFPPTGPVFAYNSGFEAGVIGRLADALPDQRAALLSLKARLVDLLPITRAAYYHRDMRGSWSIKAVLPTIAPELDYAKLSGVQDGEGAQLAFLEARHPGTTPQRKATIRASLLAYCKQDTWAMIVLRRFLCQESLPPT